MNNNLEITSVCSTLYLCDKNIPYSVILFSMECFLKYLWSFSLQEPPSRFFIFATRKLWNYLVQVFLVGFPSFLLSTDRWNPTILGYINTKTDCSNVTFFNLDCKVNSQTSVGYYTWVQYVDDYRSTYMWNLLFLGKHLLFSSILHIYLECIYNYYIAIASPLRCTWSNEGFIKYLLWF